MPAGWKSMRWPGPLVYAILVVALAIGQIELTGSTLLAAILIAAGSILRPGGAVTKERFVVAGLVLGAYLVSTLA